MHADFPGHTTKSSRCLRTNNTEASFTEPCQTPLQEQAQPPCPHSQGLSPSPELCTGVIVCVHASRRPWSQLALLLAHPCPLTAHLKGEARTVHTSAQAEGAAGGFEEGGWRGEGQAAGPRAPHSCSSGWWTTSWCTAPQQVQEWGGRPVHMSVTKEGREGKVSTWLGTASNHK